MNALINHAAWFDVARPALAFCVTIIVLFGLLKSKVSQSIVDRPNQRSLHQNPIPRIGGLAVLCGILAGWIGLDYPHLRILLLTIFMLALISVVDDLKSLPAWQRFLVHFLAASIGVIGLSGGQPWLICVLAILAIVWMTNLFNFMDGSDGLAGGMALFGFLFLAVRAAWAGDTVFASLNLVVASSALGFLWFNFHPARVFMGDTGSIPLGFLAGLVGFAGWESGVWPFWFPLLVFSPFIVDATVTLLRRLVRGEKVWQAHREHYYQRLILLGHGHRNTALLEYALMIAAGLSALWGALQSTSTQARLLGAWALIYLALARTIDRRWREAKK
jgi:UDP-N-acetylmuramyl pentapeptide phosphotransferase/UDP-N-acetylglucosamine-1-phosphate transferase